METSVPPQGPPPASPPPPSSMGNPRTWDMLCHLSALAGFIGVPFGNVIGPLIIWQLKKNEFPSVDEHGKEALNFQISVLIYLAVCGVAAVLTCFIGWIFLPALVGIGITALVLAIIAGIKANDGEMYRYPFNLRLIK